MVKICHVSDLHWRSLSRHQEFTRAFEILFKELREIKPDLIVNTGDTYHHKTSNLSAEIFDKLVWMFNEFASIAPTITILGNHDVNLINKDRQDTISPVINAINNPKCYLLKQSVPQTFEINNKKITFHPYSLTDKDNWDKLSPIDGCINIALFHGSISGARTDTGWNMEHGDIELDALKKFDFALLGDIHMHQTLSERYDRNNVLKPHIKYVGSLLQNTHGESIKKGYCVWDIRDKDDWDVEWRKLVNLAPFVTLNWVGSVEKTLEDFEALHGKYAYLPGTRYRITSNVVIPQVQTKQFIDILKGKHKGEEVIFKTDLISNMESINTHGVELDKKSLSQDPDSVTKLYEKYLEVNKDLFRLTPEEQEEDLLEAASIIKNYCLKLFETEKNDSEARNVKWGIKELKFDNLFGYGEGNIINFEKLHDVVGILGNNRSGKSSLIGAILYTLFNTTDRGSLKNALIINNNKKYCSGEIRISVSGTDYVVERKTIRSTSKKPGDEEKASTSLNFYMIDYVDGIEKRISLNGITRDDTDKNIRNLIGDADDFLLTAFASQNNINRFIENKATKRKEILNRFLELDIFEKLFAFAKKDYEILDNQNTMYSTTECINLIERTEKEIEKLKKNIIEADEEIVTCNNKRDKLNLWIKTNENKAASIDTSSIPVLESQVKALNNQITNIEDRIKDNNSKIKDKTKEKSLLEKSIIGINVKDLEEELDAFDKLKETFNQIQKEYDKNVSELNVQQKAVKKLKMVPCGDQFPECHYIKDAHQAKETIELQTKLVEELSNNLDTCKSTLDKYVSKKIKEQISKFKDSSTKISILSSDLLRLEDKIEHDTKNIENLRKELKDLEVKLKELKKSIDLLASEEFNNKKQQMDSIVRELSGINREKNDFLISLGAKQDFLAKLLKEQTQNKDLLRKLKLYDSIQSAFSKNGIPAMVLQSQLPAINLEMAKVLDGLIDFTVTLETDTSANVMDVSLEDSSCKRLIELCSGMEKTIASLALRVALGNLSSLPRPDIFILDESFSALDEEQLKKAMELLSLFKGYFKSVLVISHQAQIKEVSDMIIEIKNNGKESRVEA